MPETAAVRDEGIGVLGLSLVTNVAIGVGQGMRARTPRSVGKELKA